MKPDYPIIYRNKDNEFFQFSKRYPKYRRNYFRWLSRRQPEPYSNYRLFVRCEINQPWVNVYHPEFHNDLVYRRMEEGYFRATHD